MTRLGVIGPRGAAEAIASLIDKGNLHQAMYELVWWSRNYPHDHHLQEHIDVVNEWRDNEDDVRVKDAYEAAIREVPWPDEVFVMTDLKRDGILVPRAKHEALIGTTWRQCLLATCSVIYAVRPAVAGTGAGTGAPVKARPAARKTTPAKAKVQGKTWNEYGMLVKDAQSKYCSTACQRRGYAQERALKLKAKAASP